MKLSWEELGGPPILKEPVLHGFGSRLTEISVVQQLGGVLTREWRPTGLFVEIDLPAAVLSRG